MTCAAWRCHFRGPRSISSADGSSSGSARSSTWLSRATRRSWASPFPKNGAPRSSKPSRTSSRCRSRRTCDTTGSACGATPSTKPRCASWSRRHGAWSCQKASPPPTSTPAGRGDEVVRRAPLRARPMGGAAPTQSATACSARLQAVRRLMTASPLRRHVVEVDEEHALAAAVLGGCEQIVDVAEPRLAGERRREVGELDRNDGVDLDLPGWQRVAASGLDMRAYPDPHAACDLAAAHAIAELLRELHKRPQVRTILCPNDRRGDRPPNRRAQMPEPSV